MEATDRLDPRASAEPGRERALIACRTCHRQYDVTGLSRGDRVRCECAALLVVEPQRPHVPRPLKCGRCGGPLAAAARACAYCDAEITLEERRLSGVCPVCFARLSTGARFCMECGVAIAPQALRAVREGAICPRCAGALRARSLVAIEVVECAGCGGLWLDPEVLAGICEDADQQELARQHLTTVATRRAPDAPQPLGRARAYLTCITCGDCMVPRNFGGGSGVIIDVCRSHGVWLDHDELGRVLDFVRAGGLVRAREREVARLEAQAARARERVPTGPPLFDLESERERGDDLAAALRQIGAWIAPWFSR